ncbi:hypothetical protein K443DRAFT_3484 [Laccaria amethystina LaAM-08-1]|uniref:Uncharacterized protein n=1 Tax=Laccaria amethystina LaAM-08-1 TaxID=1095629 RepID=A0A0C9XLK2_9AGAR|nr:hypothetical protein K443DRAFT_3484 [Laccaria amethystina LaAM-08-1]
MCYEKSGFIDIPADHPRARDREARAVASWFLFLDFLGQRGAMELVDKWTLIKQPLSYHFRLTVDSGGRGSGEKAFNGSPTLLSLSPTGTACPPMRYAPMIKLE